MPPVLADDSGSTSNQVEMPETRVVNVLVSKTNVQYKMTFRVPADEDPLDCVTEGLKNCLNENETCQDIKIYNVKDAKYQFDYVVMLDYEETVKFDADLVTQSDFNTTDNLMLASLYKYLNEEHLVKSLNISDRDKKPARYSPPESVMMEPTDTPIRSFFPLKKRSTSVQLIDDVTVGTIQLDESPVLGERRSRKRTITKKIITIYPPPPALAGIPIRVNDYNCLSDGQYLNDTIIDFYIRYLCEELSLSDRERVHVFSTQFYTRLVERGLENLDKWTKGVDIFSKDVVLVPINEHHHWYLAIISFGKYRSNDSDQKNESKISSPCIIIMDSLSGERKSQVVENLKMYLSFECRVKKRIELDFSKLKVGYPSLPRQPNLTDCGLYLLQYVECYLKDFLNGPCSANLEGWFDHSLIRHKRKKLANLICSLVSEFNEVGISDLPELSFTNTESSSDTPPSKKSRVFEVFRSEKSENHESQCSSFVKTTSSSLKPEEPKNSLIQINTGDSEQNPASPEGSSNRDVISSEVWSKNSCPTLPTSPEASLCGTEVSTEKRSTLAKSFSNPATDVSSSESTVVKRPRKFFSEPRTTSPSKEIETPRKKWASMSKSQSGSRKRQKTSSTKRSTTSTCDYKDDETRKWSAFVNNHSPKKQKVRETRNYITYSGKTEKSNFSSKRSIDSSSFVSSSASSASSSGRCCSPFGQQAYENDWFIPTHVSYQQFKNAKEVAGNNLQLKKNLKSFKKIISQVPTL